MNNNGIADRIEEIIRRMFLIFRELKPNSTEYSLFYDPKKDSAWYILIFFADNNQLKEAIKNGVCFHIHSFLANELKDSEISHVENIIYFESGNRPTEELEIDNLFEKLLEKTESLRKNAEKTNVTDCGCCGHDFDKHQLMTYQKDFGNTTAEGWIMCPEENCNCFLTWGTNYSQENV